MAIQHATLENALRNAFPDAQILCQDMAGDNDHWSVTITSPVFAGKSRIEQHKMVQQAVSAYDIHALAIKTKTA